MEDHPHRLPQFLIPGPARLVYISICRDAVLRGQVRNRSTFHLNFSGREIPSWGSFLHRLTMPVVSDHESKQPEEKSDYQEPTDDIERAQVAKQWTRAMRKYGVEARGGLGYLWLARDSSAKPITPGILPVPPECRTDTQYNKIFFVWFSMNFNILSFVCGLGFLSCTRLDSWLVSQVLGRDARSGGLWARVASLVLGNPVFQHPLCYPTFVLVSLLGISCLEPRVN